MPRRFVRYVFSALLVAFTGVALVNCDSGGGGDQLYNPTFATEIPLDAAEVSMVIDRAAAALDAPNMTVAVVDRFGRPLGIWTRNNATSTKRPEHRVVGRAHRRVHEFDAGTDHDPHARVHLDLHYP